LTNAKDAVRDFHNKNPQKPKNHKVNKIEIPMSMFRKELFRPLPETLTEPIPKSEPTKAMVYKFARSGVQALKRG